MRDELLALPWSWQAFALDKAGDWHFTQHNDFAFQERLLQLVLLALA